MSLHLASPTLLAVFVPSLRVLPSLWLISQVLLEILTLLQHLFLHLLLGPYLPLQLQLLLHQQLSVPLRLL